MLLKALDQFRNIFAAMPVQSRVIAVLLVSVMVMALGFLIRGSGTAQCEYLLGGKLFDENELDAAEMAFGKAHLSGCQRDGRRLLIPSAKRSEFLEALEASAALPTSLRSHIQAAIDSSTPFESSEQRTARVGHAKQRDLSDDIAKFPDVRSASVTYDEGERIGLGRGRKQSASVFVQPEGDEPLSQARIQMIKKMIRYSFAGMSIEDVEVTDANASSLAGEFDSNDPLARKRREEEAYYEQKIRSQLAGYGEIRVKTFADIDPTMGVEKASVKYDSQPTRMTKTRRDYEIESTSPVSEDGIVSQIGALISSNRSVKIHSPKKSATTQVEETSTEHIAGQEYETTRTAALAVKRIRVSIGLPSSYYHQVHLQQFLHNNPGKKPAELDSLSDSKLEDLRHCTKLAIQSAVLPLLPDVAGEQTEGPLVEVWDYPDLPEHVMHASSAGQATLTWLADSWQTIAMLSLAAMALLTARGAIQAWLGGVDKAKVTRDRGHDRNPAKAAFTELHAHSADRVEPRDVQTDRVQSELIERVERDPVLAARVLQSWMSEAA